MTINKAIISPAEADVILVLNADWIALDEAYKTAHIAKASTYIQTKWNCTDIDWEDSETFPDEVKEACAYFALADMNGNLYYDLTASDLTGKGNIIEETDKVASLQSTIKYSDKGVISQSALLQYPNALMNSVCTRRGVGSVKLTRC